MHEEAHTHVRFISCDGHQLYDVKERGVSLEVNGVRYIEMHRGAHIYVFIWSPKNVFHNSLEQGKRGGDDCYF